MTKVFISHSSQDDAFVRELQHALGDLNQDVWIDSRELRGGDPLWSAIQKAIEEASAYAVVVSPDALQSKWVGKELRHALDVQKQRGRDKFPVIPLSLNGTKLGVLEEFFNEEPLYIPVSSAAGGIEAALNVILVAMGKRLPADVPVAPKPKAEPLEELVLELTDLKFHEQDGVRRASARARLVYEPATLGQEKVHSEQSWRFVAPIGPIEAEELRWYLEKYAIWPSTYFRDRANKVVASLKEWGRLLHQAALPNDHTVNVMNAWGRIDGHAGRRFSVHVDASLEAGSTDDEFNNAKEASTLLLGLPWELLHDGKGFLFLGAQPTRVRRRLPRTESFDVPVVATPIRILLVTARPEDDSCRYIDHRASALPLVEAMEQLGGKVELHVLRPPTLSALGKELSRASTAEKPYHVVHFDGHGVYDRRVGLGGLCFEHPDDVDKLVERRHVVVFTDELGGHLRDHRIPLVFLEACQTAQAQDASESVASSLLQNGIASVVAMSHSVLVETARRFVEAFYAALADGARVGDAMLAGQCELEERKSRGRIFGAGELILHDWFVPVLFQEKDDPQLFTSTPQRQTKEDLRTALKARLGELPDEPETGFVGRSRELLALERLLRHERYAVLRGQGGEGKTALAAELARWMVRSHQVRRAAFVSVETHSTVAAVLDALGRQLVPGYSVATFGDLEQAVLPVERALAEQSTLLVVDNMESILLPPFQVGWTPSSVPQQQEQTDEGVHPTFSESALSEEMRHELDAILRLCARLNAKGGTRIIFTSREALPAPFDAVRHRRELHRLDREDAVKLVERVLNTNPTRERGKTSPKRERGVQPSDRAAVDAADAAREAIEQLVDAVHGHARTLALLAPSLRSRGVEATRQSLVELMAEMERQFPGSREHSVFASVELSLRRMSPANRDKAQVLGVFHGGVQLHVLRGMTGWEEVVVASLAVELVETGLATPNRYNHLTLNPALCPYLRERLTGPVGAKAGEPEGVSPRMTTGDDSDPVWGLTPSGSPLIDALTARWVDAMRGYAGFLDQQRSQNAELAATLTVLELPNLFALLDHVQRAGDAAATIALATSLYCLLKNAGKPRLLERVAQVRAASAAALGEAWNHARFQAEWTRIEQQRGGGRLRAALSCAHQLLQRTRAAGDQAYSGADYDLAGACFLLASVLNSVGRSHQALPLLDEARHRFEAIVAVSLHETDDRSRSERAILPAERMASACIAEQASCLLDTGRLDEAAAGYEEAIRRAEQLGAERDVAVGKGQLGTVRMLQRRYSEALAAYAEARERFTRLHEPGTVASIWHQTGIAYQEAGQPEAAEDVYRVSLAIVVRLEDFAGQARTLLQLGNLYADILDRPEEAAAFYRQAVDKYVEIGDAANEGRARGNLGGTLRKLRRPDEARQEIRRAIECKEPLGHAAEPWKTWDILADIETDASNSTTAAEAKRKAIACYLAYRRDGGENHLTDGRISLAVTQSLLAGAPADAACQLQQLAAEPALPDLLRPFLQALEAIVGGSRDRTLADAPDVDYSMAAEILFLIETLEQRR